MEFVGFVELVESVELVEFVELVELGEFMEFNEFVGFSWDATANENTHHVLRTTWRDAKCVVRRSVYNNEMIR